MSNTIKWFDARDERPAPVTIDATDIQYDQVLLIDDLRAICSGLAPVILEAVGGVMSVARWFASRPRIAFLVGAGLLVLASMFGFMEVYFFA